VRNRDWFEKHANEKAPRGSRCVDCRQVCEKDSAEAVSVFIAEVGNTLSFPS